VIGAVINSQGCDGYTSGIRYITPLTTRRKVLSHPITEKRMISEEKDLRVIVSDDLKWEKQCSQAVAKANKVLGLIKRNK